MLYPYPPLISFPLRPFFPFPPYLVPVSLEHPSSITIDECRPLISNFSPAHPRSPFFCFFSKPSYKAIYKAGSALCSVLQRLVLRNGGRSTHTDPGAQLGNFKLSERFVSAVVTVCVTFPAMDGWGWTRWDRERTTDKNTEHRENVGGFPSMFVVVCACVPCMQGTPLMSLLGLGLVRCGWAKG